MLIFSIVPLSVILPAYTSTFIFSTAISGNITLQFTSILFPASIEILSKLFKLVLI